MSKAKVWLMRNGTRDSIIGLFANNDIDAIKKLITVGDLISMDADAHTDKCGNFSHATFETTIDKL